MPAVLLSNVEKKYLRRLLEDKVKKCTAILTRRGEYSEDVVNKAGMSRAMAEKILSKLAAADKASEGSKENKKVNESGEVKFIEYEEI